MISKEAVNFWLKLICLVVYTTGSQIDWTSICTKDHCRYLVYELVPNGSVELHLHGLPSSPPAAHSAAANIYGDLYPRDGNGRMPLKPLGIDVPRRKKAGTGGSKIAVIVLSSVRSFPFCAGILLILLFKCGWCICKPHLNPHVPIPSQRKLLGTARSLMFGSRPGSASMSRSSNALAYKGIAKIFNSSDLMRATENFDASRILGEGGFGLVYSSILDDRRKVAVKVLKRDDQQGGREFLAEVDMFGSRPGSASCVEIGIRLYL